MWLIILTCIICACYFSLILIFYIGWKKVSRFEPPVLKAHSLSVSVVVACSNEENNILQLITRMSQQSFQQFELLIVNDHSTDKTKEIVEQAMLTFPQLCIIDSPHYGKKQALNEGVEHAKSKLIITTDADCIPSFHWLESIVGFYIHKAPDLIICPVMLNVKDSLFSRLQALEFCSLVASGAGAAGAGMPILCNAANLAFTKSVWQESFADLKLNEQSGDDIFLLESVKRRGGTIRFLKSESAIVRTDPMPTLKAFFQQRRRWASKSTSYTDSQLLITTYLIFFTSLLPFVILAYSFRHPVFLLLLPGVQLFKFVIDVQFLYSVQSFFHLQKTLYYSFVLSLLYPFYIVSLAFTSVFFKPTQWK